MIKLKIGFKSNKLEKSCTIFSEATKKYGKANAYKIAQRLQEIRNASDVDFLVQYRIGNCHPLQGDRLGQYAMDLAQPFRIIFEVISDEIVIAKIVEIVDYH